MRVKVNGVKWTVVDEAVDGLCDHESNHVSIAPGQEPRDRLDTLLHEGIHMCRPEMCEENVAIAAKTLTTLLWKDGWRRRKKHERS